MSPKYINLSCQSWMTQLPSTDFHLWRNHTLQNQNPSRIEGSWWASYIQSIILYSNTSLYADDIQWKECKYYKVKFDYRLHQSNLEGFVESASYLLHKKDFNDLHPPFSRLNKWDTITNLERGRHRKVSHNFHP